MHGPLLYHLGITLGRLPWLARWGGPWLVIRLNVPALVVIVLIDIPPGREETR
ncbi:MAG TPA: hypothetical protein VFF38_07355 [Microvirga sp.]|nr:hypothetical protein [Microvirga sp.]